MFGHYETEKKNARVTTTATATATATTTTTTPPPAAAAATEQTGEILGNNRVAWGVGGVRSPIVIYKQPRLIQGDIRQSIGLLGR